METFPISKLPDELLLHILERVPFYSLQKECTLVCKKWFVFIRNSPSLSRKIAFTPDFTSHFEAEDFHEFLTRNWPNDTAMNWPKIELRLNSKQETLLRGINFEVTKLL